MMATGWMIHFFQVICALGLLTAFGVVLNQVCKTEISDKYGLFWVLLLSGALWFDLSRNWFAMATIQFGIFATLACFTFVTLGIIFSIQLTAYSKIRRSSIQEVALLRCRYEELQKKMELQAASPEAALPR